MTTDALTHEPIEAEDLSDLSQRLVLYKEQEADFHTIDESKLTRAALFVGGCRAAEDWIEADRVEQVKPLNDEVKQINKDHNDVKNGFAESRQYVEQQVGTWRAEQKRLADEAQRLAIQRAEEERRQKELELKRKQDEIAKREEEQRLAEEAARLEEHDLDRKIAKAEKELRELEECAPENASPAYLRSVQRAEEKVHELKVEKNALEPVQVDPSDLAEEREQLTILEAEVAAPVVAQVVEQVSRTVKTTAGSVSFGDMETDWVLPSWNRKTKFLTSELVSDEERAMVPERIQFLLDASILDAPQLNALYKAKRKFPKPFGQVPVMGGSTVRKS